MYDKYQLKATRTSDGRTVTLCVFRGGPRDGQASWRADDLPESQRGQNAVLAFTRRELDQFEDALTHAKYDFAPLAAQVLPESLRTVRAIEDRRPRHRGVQTRAGAGPRATPASPPVSVSSLLTRLAEALDPTRAAPPPRAGQPVRLG